MRVPLFDLTRQYEALRTEIMSAVDRVFSSGQLILSEEVAAFETEIAARLGAGEAIGVANGSDALYIALKAIHIREGDYVITTPYTFFATVSAIVRNRAIPLFTDIDPITMNIDLDQVEHLLQTHPHRHRIKAFIPVHLFGQTCDLDRLASIRSVYGLRIIEDIAQSIGSTWIDKAGRVRHSGTVGDLCTLSFFPTKNLGAFGDAGMILSSDPELATFCRSFRVHGSKERYFHDEIGVNSRLDEVQAAILRIKNRRLDEWTEKRITNAGIYHRLFSDQKELSGRFAYPRTYRDRRHIFHQYVIVLQEDRREALKTFLNQNGIGTSIYYPLPLHLQKCFAFLGGRPGDFPVSELAAKRSLALPMFPELTEEEIGYVADRMNTFFRQHPANDTSDEKE